MNKKIKVTSAAAAALASLVLVNANVNNEVKADTKPVNATKTTQKAQTPEEAAQANVDSAKKNVEAEQGNVDKAKGDLDQAKKDAEKLDADYKAQSDKVDGLKKTADQKNNALTDAQNKEKDAQALANEANDPAKVKDAKDAVTNQEVVVKDANKAKAAADKAVKDKQKEIDDLKGKVQSDTRDVNDKTAAKKQADQAVQNASDALKGTGITEAKDAVDTYQSNVDNLTQNIRHNQGVLKHNQDVLKGNQDKLEVIKKDLAQAKSDTHVAKVKLDTDQGTLGQKTQDLQKAKDLANTAAGFFKSLAEDQSLFADQREDAKTAYGILMNDGEYGVKLTWYHPDQQLGKDGDATSLANMQSALNDLDELVKVRHEYGVQFPHISLTATAIAMMSSDFLKIAPDFDHPINQTESYGPFWADEEDIASGTDYPEFEQVRSYMSEKQYIDDAIAKDGSLQKYAYDNNKPLTQDVWKRNTDYWNNHLGKLGYQVIGHYLSMINPSQDSIGAARTTGTLASGGKGSSSIDMLQYYNYNTAAYEHLYPSFTIYEYKDLVNSYVANPDKANFVQAAQAAVNSAQGVVDHDHEDFNHKFNDIQKPLEEQVKKFNEAIKDEKDAINRINKQISDDQSDLSTQRVHLNQATDRYKTLIASNDKKVKNYKATVKAQKEAETALKTANDTLSQAKTKLAQAQEDLPTLKQTATEKGNTAKDEQTKLDQLTQHVVDLKNAATILADAKKAVTGAQIAYDTAKKNYDDANKVLNGDWKTNKDKADAKVVAAQKAYDETVAKLQAAKNKLAEAQQKLQDILDAEYAQSIITSGPTETKKTDKQVKKFNEAIKDKKDAINRINKQISDDQSDLSTQRVHLNQATDRYKTLTASNDKKVKNYKATVKAQKEAETALKTANDTLSQAKTKLAQAQEDLPTLKQTATEKGNTAKDEQTKLDQLTQHVVDLKNAATILADAKKAVTGAQITYDTAKKNYDDANKVLNGDWKTNKDKADAKVVAQQKLQDILDAEYAQSIITSGPTETKKTDKQELVKTPEVTSETKTDDISTAPKKISLTHNAFVYNKYGKLIRKGLHIKWIKRDKLVKVLKNAKIVKINGKRYYQIGGNKFVKVANFEITTHAVHFKARLKGNKKVRAYNRAGKFNKHYARPNHTYTFNEKAKINGKTCYKIAGTNNWIPAKKLALKK